MKQYNERTIIDNNNANEELDARMAVYLKSVDIWGLAAFALNLVLTAAAFLFLNAR